MKIPAPDNDETCQLASVVHALEAAACPGEGRCEADSMVKQMLCSSSMVRVQQNAMPIQFQNWKKLLQDGAHSVEHMSLQNILESCAQQKELACRQRG